MIVRAGLCIVALVSAIRVCQLNINGSRKPSTSRDKNEKATCQHESIEKKIGKSEESHVSTVKPREKEEPQVKTYKCKSVEQLNFRRPEFSVLDRKGPYVSEIDLLDDVVKEKLKEGENLEVRLIELYCLKEQQSRIAPLRKQLVDKTSEISTLNATIDKLKAEKEKLYEEVKLNQLAEKQLEGARLTILELQAKRELGAEQMEGQLMLLKEQVLGFCKLGEYKGHNKADRKLRAVKNVELKAIEIKRRNIELQLEKRELVVKLNAAKAKIAELSCTTEHKIVAQFQEEISRLTHGNDNLAQEVDKLQKDRFSFLEELVYQRQLNKCLRFELEDHRSPGPKKIKPIVSSKLNFWSDSNSSELSSVDGDELINTSTTSSSTNEYDKNQRHGLIHTIKTWARSKDSSNSIESESRNPQSKPGRIRRFSTSSIPSNLLGSRSRGVLFSSKNHEALDSNPPENSIESESRNPQSKPGRIRRFSTSSIPSSLLGSRSRGVLFSSKNHEALDSNPPEKPVNRRTRRVSFNDSINSIRYIYEDRPKSDQETSDNSQKISENSSDGSGMKTCFGSDATMERKKDELPSSITKGDKLEREKAELPSSITKGDKLERKKAEMPSSTTNVQSHEATRELNHQYQAEIMSSGMLDGSPGTSNFRDQVVNLAVGVLLLVLFLVLIYFRLVSAF